MCKVNTNNYERTTQENIIHTLHYSNTLSNFFITHVKWGEGVWTNSLQLRKKLFVLNVCINLNTCWNKQREGRKRKPQKERGGQEIEIDKKNQGDSVTSVKSEYDSFLHGCPWTETLANNAFTYLTPHTCQKLLSSWTEYYIQWWNALSRDPLVSLTGYSVLIKILLPFIQWSICSVFQPSKRALSFHLPKGRLIL